MYSNDLNTNSKTMVFKKSSTAKTRLSCLIMGIIGSINSYSVLAQSASQSVDSGSDQIEEAILVVSPRVVARDRVESIQPILSYDIAFFQRFEPTNLGDMLKRIPGLNIDSLFSSSSNFSDTEANGFGFRGAFGRGAGQILLNGRRIPGINDENTLSFSGIPAELVKKIEVHRTGSADIDAQGYGLTVNVVLKDGQDIPSTKNGYWRTNLRQIGDETSGNVSGSFRGSLADDYDFSVSYSFDNNSRNTVSTIENKVFNQDADGNITTDADMNFTREETLIDKTQLGLNLTLDKQYENDTALSVQAYYFSNDRDDDTEGVMTSTNGFDNPDFLAIKKNTEEQRNFGSAISLALPLGADSDNTLTFDLSYDESSFDYTLSSALTPTDAVTDDDSQDLERSELKFEVRLDLLSYSTYDVKLGVHTELNETDIDSLGDIRSAEQSRIDFFGIYSWHPTENFSVDLGYRYETTDNEAMSSGSNQQLVESDQSTSNPSAHIRWSIAENHDLRFSAASNVSRPPVIAPAFTQVGANTFEYLDPDQEEYISTELDYEYHFDEKRGIIGFALFHKESDNIPQVVEVQGVDEVRTFIANNQASLLSVLNSQAQNGSPVDSLDVIVSGDGENILKGAELDFSIPMRLIGLPDLSFSSNISYFEREFDDDRAVDSVAANFTLDHKVGSLFSYGVSYNIKGDETIRFVNQDGSSTTRVFDRDPSVDIFVEKRFNKYFLARLVAENIDDASEGVTNTLNIANQANPASISRDRAQSDSNVQLILRGVF
ncbi:TonB-dependent receptor plug domain-containing protein [Agarilytica rhodophyticola]|uniref:TonB-dependent receptor plug domain-containing protein n=1 Tax=Agarilytica rhodophyticola TaxID=1737490 RepID=UPI000B3427B1|nr:TonB-dependent receptor [Agarilytica rhodophyticola]